MSVNKLRLEYYLSDNPIDISKWEKIKPLNDRKYQFQYCYLISINQLNEFYFNKDNNKWLIVVKYIKKGGKRH